MANKIINQSIEDFKASIAKARVKTKAYSLCALWDIISKEEGLAKRQIILDSLSQKDIMKFQGYIEIFRSLLGREPLIEVSTEKKKFIVNKASSDIDEVTDWACTVMEWNKGIDTGEIPSDEIEDILTSLKVMKLYDKGYEKLFRIEYNSTAKAFYLVPTGLWGNLQSYRRQYIEEIKYIKPYEKAFMEYIDKYSYKYENLPRFMKRHQEELTNPQGEVELWHLSEEWLKEWLKELVNIKEEEALKVWLNKPFKTEEPWLFPPYDEIEADERTTKKLTGNSNYFGVWQEEEL